ncbi:uncharacterized protein LOC133315145 [Gastrolobium bilobum]|uniref:uncharacterized protein LOC133315145 n=1 Tax=Gastrolobium bilobum TaxID=150636 RepID=UPI002AB20F10|nr:uncharacterized protein LOC133315145 [Gastrolobium bilobum]
MDSFSFHKLKAEKKANRTVKHRQLRKIANLLRYVEVCVVLVLISRLSIQLPVAVKNSSEYFRGFMISPRFVFLVGNIIIITLFAQSGQFSAHASSTTAPELDILHEFLHSSTINHKIQANKPREKPSMKGQRIDNGGLIKYQEKENNSLEVKDYRRCQSEINIRRVQSEKPRRVLQRCETDNSRRNIEFGGVPESESESEKVALSTTSYPEDGMSNDEFRRTVEAFIARQVRLRT